MNYESLFVSLGGRTSRGQFVPALIVLLAVVVFYAFLVTGRTATWCLFVLVFPAFILLARRLHDMGHSAWLLFAPTLLMILAFAVWLRLISVSAQLATVIPVVALAIAAAFALWGCIGKGKSDAH